jgi:hypothetical protein
MLNQLSLLVAVVKTSTPSEFVDATSSGICLENPLLGSLLLVIVVTPTRVSVNSNNRKNTRVLELANASFFFQLRRVWGKGLRLGMRQMNTAVRQCKASGRWGSLVSQERYQLPSFIPSRFSAELIGRCSALRNFRLLVERPTPMLCSQVVARVPCHQATDRCRKQTTERCEVQL